MIEALVNFPEKYRKYKLAAQVRGFYDTPFWKESDPKPEYWDLFDWHEGFVFAQKGELAGSLKEDLFDTLEKKIAYLQGVFEDLSEGCGIIRGENWIQFANSQPKVDLCKKWLNEIGDEFKVVIFPGDSVEKHEITYHIPICHKITINKDLVRIIKNNIYIR